MKKTITSRIELSFDCGYYMLNIITNQRRFEEEYDYLLQHGDTDKKEKLNNLKLKIEDEILELIENVHDYHIALYSPIIKDLFSKEINNNRKNLTLKEKLLLLDEIEKCEEYEYDFDFVFCNFNIRKFDNKYHVTETFNYYTLNPITCKLEKEQDFTNTVYKYSYKTLPEVECEILESIREERNADSLYNIYIEDLENYQSDFEEMYVDNYCCEFISQLIEDLKGLPLTKQKIKNHKFELQYISDKTNDFINKASKLLNHIEAYVYDLTNNIEHLEEESTKLIEEISNFTERIKE